MEENMESTVTEDTTPEGGEESTEAVEQTESVEESADTAEPDDGGEAEPAQEAEPTLMLHYNHQPVEISQKDAVTYCQRWMHISREGGTLDKLNRLADGFGVDADKMLEDLLDLNEEKIKASLLEECGGNQEVADKLYELDKIKRGEAIAAAAEKRKNDLSSSDAALQERLASEFSAMQEDFGLDDFSKLPKSVVDTAIGEDINLRDAYLRYWFAESKRKNTNQTQMTAAAKSTAGSQTGVAEKAEDPVMAAMIRAIRGG